MTAYGKSTCDVIMNNKNWSMKDSKFTGNVTSSDEKTILILHSGHQLSTDKLSQVGDTLNHDQMIIGRSVP